MRALVAMSGHGGHAATWGCRALLCGWGEVEVGRKTRLKMVCPLPADGAPRYGSIYDNNHADEDGMLLDWCLHSTPMGVR